MHLLLLGAGECGGRAGTLQRADPAGVVQGRGLGCGGGTRERAAPVVQGCATWTAALPVRAKPASSPPLSTHRQACAPLHARAAQLQYIGRSFKATPPAAGVHHAGLRAGAGGVRAHRGAAGALPKQVGLLAAPRIDSCVAMCRCNSVCDCALCSLWRRRRCAVLQALRSACLPATPCHARPQGQCDGVGLLHLGSHGHLFLFHQQRPNGT